MSDLARQADELEKLYPSNKKASLADLANELESLSSAPAEIPGQSAQAPQEQRKPGFLERQYVAPLETAASLATGAVAAPISAVAGIYKNLTSGKFGTQEGLQIARERQQEVQDSLTYQPRSEAGKEAVSTIGKVMEESKLAGLGPTEAISLGGVMAGPGRIAKAATRAEEVPQTAKFGSAGAASASAANQLRATVANSSPELQAILEKHLEKTPRITQEALERNLPVMQRHVEADSLGIRLTKGQATGDTDLLSKEQNRRGAEKAYQDRFNDQNKQLVAKVEETRQEAAPDIYAQTKPEHGEILIDAYKAKDAKINSGVSAKYQALRDANGGDFPLDSKAFVETADAALHKQLLYDQVPSGLRSTLDRLRDTGSMTFENFESMRTNLARIQRSQADGNVKHAAGIIRNALEEIPMPPGGENLKPLADAARSAARERFALIESDPAYKAVVNGKASADNFIDKHVIGADTKSVQALKDSLADDPTAQQAVASGVVNHLKQRAGLSADNAGNFAQSGYNKAMDGLRPKLGIIFQPEQKQKLETIGKVARYTQEQPRGSFVNNANTFVAAMAEGAKSTAEGAANVAFKGAPVGTWTRKLAGRIRQHREDMEALQTGAGIRLKEIGK